MRTVRLIALVALLFLVVPRSTAHAQPLDQTVISFSIADDDILKDAGETRKNSPDAYIGGQASNAVDRVGGSVYNKTSTRTALYKRLDLGALSPEGALKLRFAADSSGNYSVADDSTYLALNWQPSEDNLFKLTMFPVDSDRFRLGYHYDVSWGGTHVFPRNFTKGLVPGVKLEWETPFLNAFVGMKTALVRSPAEDILDNPGGNTNQFVERTYYGALAGVDVKVFEGLHIMANGGYFTKGTSTRSDVLGSLIHSGGGGGAIRYSYGGKVGRRLDLRMYYEDPEKYPINGPRDYSQDFGLEVAVEYNHLAQVLEDPDNAGSTEVEHSSAAALSLGLRFDKLRLHFDGIYRDLSYIVWNVPGFVPNQALPESADIGHGGPFSFLPEFMGGEFFFVLSSDYFFELPRSSGLTPAVSIGLLLPATYTPNATGTTIEGPAAAEVAQGIQTTVVRGSSSGDWDMLPVGEDELPVFLVKFDLRYNLSQHFSLIGEVSYANDNNYAQVEIDPQGHAERVYVDPNIIGLGIVSELAF